MWSVKTDPTQRRCPVTTIQAWKRTLLRPLLEVVSRARCHWPEACAHRSVRISAVPVVAAAGMDPRELIHVKWRRKLHSALSQETIKRDDQGGSTANSD